MRASGAARRAVKKSACSGAKVFFMKENSFLRGYTCLLLRMDRLDCFTPAVEISRYHFLIGLWMFLFRHPGSLSASRCASVRPAAPPRTVSLAVFPAHNGKAQPPAHRTRECAMNR